MLARLLIAVALLFSAPAAVAQTGAVAIWLDVQHVATAADATGDRPWQPH